MRIEDWVVKTFLVLLSAINILLYIIKGTATTDGNLSYNDSRLNSSQPGVSPPISNLRFLPASQA